MFFLILLVILTIILMLSTINCCKKNEDAEVEDATTENLDESEENPDPSAESSEGSQEGGEPTSNTKEKPLEMSANNPQVLFVQKFQGEPTEEFVKNVTGVANSASVFVWGAKKRAAAIKAAWKDLAKRIITLQTEGFDVLAGSDEARVLRKLESQRQIRPALLEKIEPIKPKKKKKKKGKKKRKKKRDSEE